MQINGFVGPFAAADGASPPARQTRTGELAFSEVHGRFFEQAVRGNVFSAGGSLIALSANTIGLTATATPIIGVWNPASNTKNLAILQASIQVMPNALVSGAGPGAFVWATSTGNGGLTLGAVPFNRSTLQAAGSVARGFVGNVALTGLTNNLVIAEAADFPTVSGLTYGTFPATAILPTAQGVQHFDGGLIVPPGGVLALLNTVSSTLWSAAARIMWEEVPL
jgi:hypothetical protein